jgi:hypothetical protein
MVADAIVAPLVAGERIAGHRAVIRASSHGSGRSLFRIRARFTAQRS